MAHRGKPKKRTKPLLLQKEKQTMAIQMTAPSEKSPEIKETEDRVHLLELKAREIEAKVRFLEASAKLRQINDERSSKQDKR
jgi:hypothetical protein